MYSIVVGANLLPEIEDHLKRAGLIGPFLLVSQPRIHKALGKKMPRKLARVFIPDGERAKSLTTVSRLLSEFARQHLTRQSAVIALGGGVVGDVTGFAASIYMRGIAVVQVPTTLLAQVDSSIGGKTGVNFGSVKNLVGTFHQPALVLSDVETLQTLPEREFRSGLYEALKYGVLGDAALFQEFQNGLDRILARNSEAVQRLVSRCAAIKADIVSRDEKEGDLRRVLNLGHTVGHGLEAAAGLRRLKHGEAVGLGMIAAARISRELGKLNRATCLEIEATIRAIGTLPSLSGLKVNSVLKALRHDKKVRDGAVHFILPLSIGRVEITRDVPLGLVSETVKTLIHEDQDS